MVAGRIEWKTAATRTRLGVSLASRNARVSHSAQKRRQATALQTLCALHQGHHLGGVAFADDLDLGQARFDAFQVGWAQGYIECSHVFFKIANTLCAGDGHEAISLSEYPG